MTYYAIFGKYPKLGENSKIVLESSVLLTLGTFNELSSIFDHSLIKKDQQKSVLGSLIASSFREGQCWWFSEKNDLKLTKSTEGL